MASRDLTDGLQALSLHDSNSDPDPDPECLPFCPVGDEEWLQKIFQVPRYLFRIFTPNSRCASDMFWAKSMAASEGSASCKIDIFTMDDNTRVARMLYTHLKWWTGPDDNLVSWTSSLLFALVYMFSLHANARDGSDFDKIHLCIVDTSCFPKGVFLRDIDLIIAYRRFHRPLKRFGDLRSRKHKEYSGSYYFGEYLSQGALKIANKCEIVSAQAMIDKGLYSLQPEFKRFSQWDLQFSPPWAHPVIKLREGFYRKTAERQGRSKQELEAAIAIAQLFGPRWRLPVAANLIATLPHQVEESDILQAFGAPPFTDDERRDCSPSATTVMAYDTLPEVERFGDIMRSIYKEFCPREIELRLVKAEAQLRSATIHYQRVESSASAGLRSISMDSTNNSMLRRLDRVGNASLLLRQEILGECDGRSDLEQNPPSEPSQE